MGSSDTWLSSVGLRCRLGAAAGAGRRGRVGGGDGKTWSVPYYYGYKSQIGIALRLQSAVAIGGGAHLLLADGGLGQVSPGNTIQDLLAEAKNTLGLNEGDCYTMLIADQPSYPEASPGVMLIADASSDQQPAGRTNHVLGVCALVQGDRNGESFDPIVEANLYFNTYPEKIKATTAKLRVLQQPKHGTLQLPNPMEGRGLYIPSKGYFGNDSYIVDVTGNGHTVKIHYFVRIVEGDGESIFGNKNCKGQVWKISQPPTDTPNTVTAASTSVGIIGDRPRFLLSD